MAENSDSDSEYESMHSTFHAYKQVLQPLTAHELHDMNLWPCFLLENAQVFDKQGRFVSLLDVGVRGPFTATGRLTFDSDRSLRDRLINKKFRDGSNVKIQNITQYSFGSRPNALDSGHIALWAGETQYGWFELNPAPDYEPFYAGDIQSIGILYFFQALYKRKGAKDMAIEDLLLNYTAREGSGATRAEMEARIKSHADFLFRQMILKEDGDITKTVFYAWLANECPDVIADLKKRKIAIEPFPFSPKTKTVRIAPPIFYNHTPTEEPHEPGPDDIIHDGNQEYLPQPAKSSPILIDDSDDEAVDESYPVKPPNTDIPGVIIYIMELNRLGRGKKDFCGMDRSTFSKIASYLFLECSLSVHQWGTFLMIIHRDAILARLPPVWHDSPFHREYLETTYAKVTSNMKGESHEKVKWQQQAAAFTELNLRRPIAFKPRNTMGPRSHKPSKLPAGGSGNSIRNNPVSRAVASSRTNTSNSNSRQNTPPTAAISSRRQQALPQTRRRKSTPPIAIPSGRAAIVTREAEKRVQITSGESNTPPPTGKKPTRTVIFASERAKAKRDADAMDLDSPSPEPEEKEEEIKPVSIGITKRYLDGSPTATVAVLSAESQKLGHKVDFLTERVMGMGRERADAEQEVIGGRVVPKVIRKAMLD